MNEDATGVCQAEERLLARQEYQGILAAEHRYKQWGGNGAVALTPSVSASVSAPVRVDGMVSLPLLFRCAQCGAQWSRRFRVPLPSSADSCPAAGVTCRFIPLQLHSVLVVELFKISAARSFCRVSSLVCNRCYPAHIILSSVDAPV